MAAQLLQPSDILQRRTDILGIAQNISISSTEFNQVSLIFNTGNIAFPTGANRVFVAYLIVEFSSGAPVNANCYCNIGSSGTNDWSRASLDLFPATTNFDPPYVFSPSALSQPNYNPIVYPKNVPFTFTNRNGTSLQTTRATVTAVGWAE